MPVMHRSAALAGLLALAAAGRAQPPAANPPTPRAAFEDLARRAGEAREQNRLDEAVALYRQAVASRPAWAEGWWYLGSIAYEADRHAECRDALARLVALDARVGPGWALRGLCEFALGQYAASERHLARAVEVGPVADEPMWRVVLYHQVLLLLRRGEFELAIPPLRQLAQAGERTPEILDACGLRLLRRATLPRDVPSAERALLRLAGRAECETLAGRRSEAEAAFAELLAAYPKERHVHYAHGLFLAGQGSREAIAEHRRETELFPDHVLAHVELAFNLLTHGQPEEARRAAEAAVRLDPKLFAAHLALGRALFELGRAKAAIPELESAARLAPGVPEIQLALARAYAKDGRMAEAERANARFRELEERRRQRTAPAPSR